MGVVVGYSRGWVGFGLGSGEDGCVGLQGGELVSGCIVKVCSWGVRCGGVRCGAFTMYDIAMASS